MGDVAVTPDVKEVVEDEVCGELASEAEGGKDYAAGHTVVVPKIEQVAVGPVPIGMMGITAPSCVELDSTVGV